MNVEVDVDALHTRVISATKAIKFERQVALLEARIAAGQGRWRRWRWRWRCSCSNMFMARNGLHVMGFTLSDNDSLQLIQLWPQSQLQRLRQRLNKADRITN